MDWSAEAIEQLRALWAEGHSTAEIGRRMGISKNAVVGKAHRLHLPARPSPIQREQAAAASAAPRPIAAVAPVAAPAPRPVMPVAPRPPAPAMRAAPPAVVRPFPRSGARTCCWPIGEPGTPEFRFCTSESFAGKPYCLEHASIAYVKARDRREDAA
ncbi:GcrA family cell cycle regulator [Pararoseomonas indoligenes]|uniref:GcrA cell cycle regulator n=1 Tax=Roseomonas indoligenes TaxID=2820811 RepID=A0A940N8Y4_9PROT|nr:GcrA cell cycle regulator [Pararoseomonas indoligenes]